MAKKDAESIIKIINAYKDEATDARSDRMDKNQFNFDIFHLKQDFSHKKSGQSQEFLGKVQLAVEQITSFIQQGLIDIGDWFGVELKTGMDVGMMKIKPDHVRAIMKYQLEQMDFHLKVADSLKLGLLGSLMISKIHGRMCPKPKFIVRDALVDGDIKKQLVAQEEKVWELSIDLIRQEDYFPDPTGRGLYVIQRSEIDYHDLLAMAKEPDSLYDLKEVQKLAKEAHGADVTQDAKKNRETDQDATVARSYRKTIEIFEFWGSLIDPTSGEMLYENVMATVASDNHLIQKPTPNPLWHQRFPFVASPVMRVPNSVWHKALMDAPAQTNKAINELYNLMVDGAMMSVHGIKQLRVDGLEDSKQVADGIAPGTTLQVTSQVPFGAQVLERVDTSSIPQDALAMYNNMLQEFNQSTLTNDLRLGGLVKGTTTATEIVESSQSITSVFTGMAKNIEVGYIEDELELAWFTIAQNFKKLDADVLEALIGKDSAGLLMALSEEEIFADSINGLKFKVYGISRTLTKIKDFRKLQSLLQVIGSSEIFLEAFAKNYDFNKLLEEIMRSLDINTDKIKLPEAEMGLEGGGDPMAAMQGAPQAQSQIPQAGAAVNDNAEEEGGLPRSGFPQVPGVGGG